MDHQRAIEYYNNGLQNAKEGKWDEAIDLLSKAIAENPKHVNSYNVMGKVYIQKDEVDAAKKCWRKALGVDPENAIAKQCLAAIGKGFGRIQARKLLWPAVVFIFLAVLIITNSVLLRRIGDLETKLQAFGKGFTGAAAPVKDQTIGNIPELPGLTAIHRQPTILLRLETDSQVTEAYNQALGDCRSEHYDWAMEVFQQILEYSQPHQLKDNAQYWLAECYYAQKKYVQALDEFQKVKKLFPEGNKIFDAELKVAHSYYYLGRIEEAKQQLSQLSKDWPHQQYRSRIAPLWKVIQSSF